MPANSTLRASRMLDVNIHMAAWKEQPPFTQTTPHDAYLFAGEDASASVDDFSGFDFDLSNSQRSENRRSHEDTARVVSVIFAGKPSIVDLPRRSTSPSSKGSNSRPPRRLRRSSTEPVLTGRCTSICSSASSPIIHPHRTYSMGPRKLEKQRPQFLNIDPFAAKPELEQVQMVQEERATPNKSMFPMSPISNPSSPVTPTGTLNRLRQGFSAARRRSIKE
ncbi:hypothetical protein BKA56DRAFT_680278 [Ilyonectria sp. MPI-CAGE-AT-0026]|nr:hypothetical protein BKA56DRAFT_680278 [Ilyonectria sp. MPI-CAGE-AT-0026]